MLTLVLPDDLHGVWDALESELHRTIRKTGGDHWIPADVYTAIRTHNAYLYSCDGGWFVLQKHADPDGPVLFVWIMVGVDMMRHKDAIWEALDGFARTMGAKRIRWHSKRKAYAKLGGTLVSHIWERQL